MSTERAASTPTPRGRTLLAAARDAIARAVGAPPVAWEDGPWLDAPGATFVTLRQDGELRGCIGSLEARRPLREDVRANAVASALRDDRFPPLTAEELARTRVEVSELSPMRPLPEMSEEEAVNVLKPGEDGVLLESGWHRGTFLPQVWEDVPEPRDFLHHLKRKAGLPPSLPWPSGTHLFVYSVTKHAEEDS